MGFPSKIKSSRVVEETFKKSIMPETSDVVTEAIKQITAIFADNLSHVKTLQTSRYANVCHDS